MWNRRQISIPNQWINCCISLMPVSRSPWNVRSFGGIQRARVITAPPRAAAEEQYRWSSLPRWRDAHSCWLCVNRLSIKSVSLYPRINSARVHSDFSSPIDSKVNLSGVNPSSTTGCSVLTLDPRLPPKAKIHLYLHLISAIFAGKENNE